MVFNVRVGSALPVDKIVESVNYFIFCLFPFLIGKCQTYGQSSQTAVARDESTGCLLCSKSNRSNLFDFSIIKKLGIVD